MQPQSGRTVAYQISLSIGFPRKNTGVDCHFLFQGIFPIQGSNPHLLLCQAFLATEWLGKPEERITSIIFLYIISSPTPPTQFLSSCLLLFFIVIFWCTVLIPLSVLKLYIFSCFLNDCLMITINILIYKNLVQVSFTVYKNLASIWLHPFYIITYYIFIHCVLINIHLLIIIVLHICLLDLIEKRGVRDPK